MGTDDDRPGDWTEARRKRAFELMQKGWKACRIAEALGVSKAAVSQWKDRLEQQGPAAWRTCSRPGRPPRLTQEQLEMLPSMLSQGAPAWGFRGEVWTCARVGCILRWQFGVHYHTGYVAQLLKRVQFSPQVPQKRAAQRDEQAIEHWRRVLWPALKKRRASKVDSSPL